MGWVSEKDMLGTEPQAQWLNSRHQAHLWGRGKPVAHAENVFIIIIIL